jgi:hypothetical protein
MGHKNIANRNYTIRIIHDTLADEKILINLQSVKSVIFQFAPIYNSNIGLQIKMQKAPVKAEAF